MCFFSTAKNAENTKLQNREPRNSRCAGRQAASDGRILLLPPVGENMTPHPDPLPIRWGEGEDRLAAGSRAASHPNPLSIRWREGEEGWRGGWWY